MTLESYISDLLYRYDCVIVPNFGGFVTNNKSAEIRGHTFVPPFKQITFNSLLKNNDGLLANHIANSDKMPYETAVNFINFEVEEWLKKLSCEELDLTGIGSFNLVADKIIFEPETQTNFLTDSFGLDSYVSDIILRKAAVTKQLDALKEDRQPVLVDNRAIYKEQVVTLEQQAPIFITPERRKKSSNFLKYAAIFVLGVSITGLIGKKAYDDQFEKQQITIAKKQQDIRQTKIQTATFVITNPLPTITLNASTETPVENYHIIAGAFRNKDNAFKKVSQLMKQGFNAKVVGQNKWHLWQVAFDSFSSLEKANTQLVEIKNTVAKDAWLLVKD
jgi:hypothetical protein